MLLLNSKCKSKSVIRGNRSRHKKQLKYSWYFRFHRLNGDVEELRMSLLRRYPSRHSSSNNFLGALRQWPRFGIWVFIFLRHCPLYFLFVYFSTRVSHIKIGLPRINRARPARGGRHALRFRPGSGPGAFFQPISSSSTPAPDMHLRTQVAVIILQFSLAGGGQWGQWQWLRPPDAGLRRYTEKNDQKVRFFIRFNNKIRQRFMISTSICNYILISSSIFPVFL